jgi:hypothetical protein
MAKLDEVKEYIGFLKAIFVTFIVINTSLIAWVFKSFEVVESWKLYVVLGLIIMLSLSIYGLFLEILKKIKSLKDID